MSLKVLVISHMYPNPCNPTAGIFVHNQIKSMADEGVECRVVSPIPRFPFYPKWRRYREFPRTATMNGIPIRYVPTWMFPGGLFFFGYGYLYYKALVGTIAKIRKSFPFDLIHCHTIYPDGYAGAMLKNIFSVPVVTTIHGSDVKLYPYRSDGVYRRTEEALRMNDHIITVSEQLKRDALKIAAGVEVTTIYNGFDPQWFYPRCREGARKKLGQSENGPSILYVGNLYPVKGVDYLLEAFARVVPYHDDVTLHLVGDGPLRSELQKQAREKGIADQVRFVGRKPHEEIPWWINSSDIVVLSSLSEGMPSILLEAMGCGKPVVATDVGGISEILQHRRTGFLVKPKQPEEMARFLSILLMEDEGLVYDMGERAFTESGALTWKRNAQRVRELYIRVLERGTD
ncbi:glycosyltransferase family 4 protein [Paludifilum halophilum]|uniref:Glycosyl transferase family 1 n=1 Tax=Paludifilum halophilum TaxID=1642702 RepID=A0A235B6W6_9BACL|nr:glycosyltransferase family 4 protein [Paludifilum halophilum]OYD08036.1 hypothetical protein CHM34_07940 [Paludifilum halophilum]